MKLPSRLGVVHLSLTIFAIAIVVQAARVQLVHGAEWRAKAESQQYVPQVSPAPRGAILDETGAILAQDIEMVRLSIAPRELRDREKVRQALKAAGLPADTIARALDTTLKWVVIRTPVPTSDAAAAIPLAGIYSAPASERQYALSNGAHVVVGHVDADDHAVDGIELALDSILRGVPGSSMLIRSSHDGPMESPVAPPVAPVMGETIVLTLNHQLQEIAENALADAVTKMGAEGGDIVILDPHSGEIRALASIRADRSATATALTEPFEPGSTMKPFLAAGLLERGLVSDADSVDTGNGVLDLNGRIIHDDTAIGRAPLANVIRFSSNVGIVKFSQRLTPGDEFEGLRDFGFGTPTGVPFPSEASGTLNEPVHWSKQSANSMAMGYEVAVTPLQLALAYAVFADSGRLLEPALVKEIRAPDGAVRYRHSPRIVRQVVSPAVASRMLTMLIGVVEAGTAVQADLANYLLAGKTGTPRGTVHGKYVLRRYNPNFVGLFPGDAPQYVIVVKLTNPQTSIFAGQTAAPLTKTVIQAALAARDVALDRNLLAASFKTRPPPAVAHGESAAASPAPRFPAPGPLAVDSEPAAPPSETFVATLPLAPDSMPAPSASRPIPDVRLMSLRAAVRALQLAGFRVQLERAAATGTTPAAGTLAPSGAVVKLEYNY